MSQDNERQENQSSDELIQVLDTLTVDQIRFVIARQEHTMDKDAAKAIGVKPNLVSQWKHKGVLIDRAVRLMAYDGLETALHLRRRNLGKAMAVKVKGLDSDEERLRQGVATEIIEWEMGKATSRVEASGPDGGPIETKETGTYGPAEHARALTSLVTALGSMGNTTDGGGGDDMDAAVPEAVAGDPQPGG